MSHSTLNQTTRAGQSLILQSGPLPALLQLTAIAPQTTGETAAAYYRAEFRLSGYGLAWPQAWQPLRPEQYQPASRRLAGRMQHLQVRLTHEGADAPLTFDGFTATGTARPAPAPTGLLATHYLAKGLYGTHRHEHLALALLAKLYRPGQLPEFLLRGEGEGFTPEAEDQDFLDLWLSSCRLLALVILHTRRLGQLSTDAELLQAYLRQRGLYLRPDALGADVGELRQLLHQQAQAGAQRGTAAVFGPRGEFSRLVNRRPDAQAAALLVAYTPADQLGWVLGAAGPGYAGTAGQRATERRYQDVALLSATRLLALPIPNPATVQVSEARRIGPSARPALALLPSAATPAQLGGLGRLGTGALASAIAIDPAVDYEILWLVRQPDPSASTLLSVHLFNGHGYPVPALDHGTGAPQSTVAPGPFPANWTWVRTILWNQRQAPGTGPRATRTNRGDGCQLRNAAGAVRLQPGAQARVLAAAVGGEPMASAQGLEALLIADILVRPLVSGSTLHPQAPRPGTAPSDRPLRYDPASGPRPLSFLGTGPHLQVWYRNQNPTYAEADIDQITRRVLVPADCHLQLHPAS